MFESGAIKLTKMLEETAKYVQVKYTSDVARIIKDVERPEFNLPERPVPRVVTNEDDKWTYTFGRRIMSWYTGDKLTSPRKKEVYLQSYWTNAHRH